MTGQELFHALSFVDERFIMEAEVTRFHKIPWMKYLSVAACLCILIVGAFALQNNKAAAPEAAPPPMAAPEAAPEAAPPMMEDTPESAMEEEPLTGVLVDIPYAKVRVVKVLEDGNFEAIVEADEPMEMDTPVIVRSGEDTVFENLEVVEGAEFEIYDATYNPETNMLYVSRVIPPEESKEIVPEAAVSVPVIYLRVAYATDEGFVGNLVAEPDSHWEDGKEINIVIEKGVEICVPVDERTGKYVNARKVTYEPGMLLEVQFTKISGNTVYPELMYVIDKVWWEAEDT